MKNLKIPQSVKTALITGGDGDIGFQFAHKLAKNKISLILVSNREDGLKKAKEQLQEEFNVNVEIFYSDLAAPHAAQEVYNFCAEKKIEVDLLINNAGIFFFEEFIRTKPEKILLMLNLHIIAVTELCRLFGAEMARRKTGFILNVSSLSAWITFPGLQMYASTKSFLQIFSRTIFYELKRHNVGVTVICPGGVNTPLYNLSDKKRRLGLALGLLISPQKLAHKALKKTFAYKQKSLIGFINHLLVFLTSHLPKSLILHITKKLPIFD